MAERSVNVNLRLKAGEYIAGARAATAATRDLDKAARDLRKAHDNEAAAAASVKSAEAKLAEVRADSTAKVSQLSAAEEHAATAKRKHQSATEDLTAATNRFAEAQKRAGNESENSSKKIGDEADKVAKRTNAAFNALAFTSLSVGLPAAAAIGAAGVVGSLALVAGGFAALGVSFVASSDEVRKGAKGMANGVLDDLSAMSQPLKKDVIGAIDDVGSAWHRLEPAVRTAIQASAPAIRQLTGAVTDFAENAMPGMITAVQASGPALAGLRTFTGQAGAGLSDFFTNVSKGSDGARQGFTVLGGTVQTLEGRLGTLFANLANGSAGPLRSLDVIVDKLSGGLVDMTAKGSGALGILQGFSNAGSGAATVLQGLLAGVSALPPQLTQLSGSWTAASMIAGKFGIDAGKGFEGLGEKIKTTAKTGKGFGDVLGGLAAGAINPAFLAVTALGIGLDILGQKEQKAAQYAAEHRDNVRELTQAIKQDSGEMGASVDAVNAKALADKNATNNLASFGVSIGVAANAIRGSSSAYDLLRGSAERTLTTIADQSGITDENKQALIGLAGASLLSGQNYDQLKDKVKLYGTAMDGTNGTVQKFTAAQQSAIEALLNGTGAIGEQINAQRQAHDVYIASEMALTNLASAQIEARDATSQHTKAIYDQQNQALGYRGALLSTQAAEEKYNKTLKDGKATAKDKAQAALDLERAYAAQEQAAYNAAYAESKATSDQGKQADATKAMNTETLKLAATFKGALPESLAKTIASMTPIEAAAAGATVAIGKTGEAVYRLPDGKEIKIKPTTEAATKALQDWRNQQEAQSITNKVFTDTGPATGQVKDWVNTTRKVEGNTTTYTYTDPATKAVSIWRNITDATGAVTTTFANVDPATGKVRVWKQNTDGTFAEVTATANADPAYRAIMDVAQRSYRATIDVGVNMHDAAGKISLTGKRAMVADGGFVSKAPIRKYAGGGMVDIRGGGLLDGPGTGRSDSILTWTSSGQAAMSKGEYVEPENRVTPKTLPILEGIRNGTIKGYADGGLVDAAREALGALNADKTFYEDFSYPGYSANLAKYNDDLSTMYFASGGSFARGGIEAWLQSYVGSQSSVQQAISSGNAVQQTPSYSGGYAGGGSAGGSGAFTGSLYLDNGTFMGVVRGEIRKDKRATRRSVTTGSGGNR